MYCRNARVGALVASLTLTSLIPAAPTAAQPSAAGGLVNRELRPLNDLDSTVGTLLGRLLGGTNTNGIIDRVVVTADEERKLAVAVFYTNLAGRTLSGEIRGPDDLPLREFRVGPPQTLGPGSNKADLTFELADNPAEGTKLPSVTTLRFTVSDGGVSVLARSVRLPKQWQAAVPGAQYGKLAIAPVPIGAAGQLPHDDPQVVLPPLVMPTQVA